jgi:hypothetical protein
MFKIDLILSALSCELFQQESNKEHEEGLLNKSEKV